MKFHYYMMILLQVNRIYKVFQHLILEQTVIFQKLNNYYTPDKTAAHLTQMLFKTL